MKKEHYEYIASKYSTVASRWIEGYEGRFEITNFIVCLYTSTWCIMQARYPSFAFTHISSKELAEEILQHIKDTEILFV